MEGVEFLPPEPGDVPESDRLHAIPHPREMLSLLGQEAAEEAFLSAYKAGKSHHAYLLTGPEGIGKATFAYRAARFLLNEPSHDADALFAPPPPESLDVSAEARVTALVARESHPDLAVLKRRYDSKTKRFRAEISVEETRETLQLFTKTAAFGGWRIVIVDAADDLNIASANAILKTLEEPPEKAIFFLVSHQPGRLLPTIRSRCQLLEFNPLSPEKIATLLARFGRKVPDSSALELEAEGSIRRALRRSEGGPAQVATVIAKAFAALPNPAPRVVDAVGEAVRTGSEGIEALSDLMDETERFLYREMQERMQAGASLAVLSDFAETWSRLNEEARRVDALNLDRRAFATRLFDEIGTLVSARLG
ncbi:MAG: DNA polymerase III subunit delta' [Rhabdaerophilum sp.]